MTTDEIEQVMYWVRIRAGQAKTAKERQTLNGYAKRYQEIIKNRNQC